MAGIRTDWPCNKDKVGAGSYPATQTGSRQISVLLCGVKYDGTVVGGEA